MLWICRKIAVISVFFDPKRFFSEYFLIVPSLFVENQLADRHLVDAAQNTFWPIDCRPNDGAVFESVKHFVGQMSVGQMSVGQMFFGEKTRRNVSQPKLLSIKTQPITSAAVYYKSFTIVIYYRNDSVLYYKTMIIIVICYTSLG